MDDKDLKLTDRLEKKDSDGSEIIDTFDKMADINFRALSRTVSIADYIHHTLATGAPYGSHTKSILTQKTELFHTISEFINFYSSISWHPMGPSTNELTDAQKKLSETITPPLEAIHRLFNHKYHQESALSKSMTQEKINVLERLDEFPALFHEPLKKVSSILAGGSKSFVQIEDVNTVEELIRVIHEGSLDSIDYLLKNFIREDWYDHIPSFSIATENWQFKATVLGNNLEPYHEGNPIWMIYEALHQFQRENPSSISGAPHMNIFLSPKNMVADLRYLTGDQINGYLKAAFDAKTDEVILNFHIGSKGNFYCGSGDTLKKAWNDLGFSLYNSGWEDKAFWVRKHAPAIAAEQETLNIMNTAKAYLAGQLR